MPDIEEYKSWIKPLREAAQGGNPNDATMYEIALAIVEGQEVNALEVAMLDSWMIRVKRLGADV